MITTLTINAAVDYTVKAKKLKPGQENEVEFSWKSAAGKGINVAKDITKLGGKAKAIACLGGPSGQYIADALEKKGIESDISWIDNETRVNMKVIDKSGIETKINQGGPIISSKTIEEVKDKTLQAASNSEIIILSGSLPSSVPQDIYQELITKLNNTKTKVFLDTSGEALRLALQAKPTLIKPNIYELESVYGSNLSLDEVIKASKGLVKDGIEMVVVSMGARGALLVTDKKVIQAIPPKVKPVSTVGAGDSMVAAMALSYLSNKDIVESFRFTIAVSVATILEVGTETPILSKVGKWMDKVKIREL
ncbi:1-phosphofructokinase [Halobacteroides halobius DSM 5150]|uniref:Tagatose-6-phosphate kinase n=1 Tax=Halobacteroides halobius (strain ATCC 35273 / DSM 5150 / MD-1) TaxID=748449 RepID=L0K8G3_HALHC|nr:1-phosphofructokinase [Halobacteroides halobius]AGB41582.1 1-phosphofructokinase [Halobacteroides halobius DSM 5150]